jgi:hypothetical protein
MALQKTIITNGTANIQTEFGVISAGNQAVSFLAYIKIVNIFGSKENINIDVSFQSDKYTFSKQFVFTPSVEDGSENFIKQAYRYLKTLPEFEGAIDC